MKALVGAFNPLVGAFNQEKALVDASPRQIVKSP